MKRTILAAGLALGLVIAGASAPAFASTPPEECIPSAAWTEVVPDIEHPAVTTTVEHPATYETVEVAPAVPEVAEQSFIEFQWKWWGKKDHGTTRWSATQPTERLNDVKDRGQYGDWRKNGNERKVITTAYQPGTPAVFEDRLVTEAWTETVIVTEAYTEVVADIEHPAVVCEEPPVVVEPVTVAIHLTYMTDCAPDATNTWRFRNPSAEAITVTLNDGNTHVATPGESFYETPRMSTTIVANWGGGDTGIKAGSTVKASGIDKTDCPVIEEPPVVVPPVEPPVVTPPVVAPPVVAPVAPAPAPAPLAAQIVADGVGGDEPTMLAQTGGGDASGVLLGLGLLTLIGGVLVTFRRRIFNAA